MQLLNITHNVASVAHFSGASAKLNTATQPAVRQHGRTWKMVRMAVMAARW